MDTLSRRALLVGSAAGGVLLAIGAPAAQVGSAFVHGVASGDPGADSVLLWTRVTTPDGAPVHGTWELSFDPEFGRLVTSGRFETSADRDHTVKVIAGQLQAGEEYFYRFRALGQTSPVGRTHALPNGRLDRLHLVLACCAMYMFGEMHAYGAIANHPRLDAVLFVGDYIYEYGAKSFVDVPDHRAVEPAHDTVTLDDYRARYAQWRRDSMLQAAHARAPWICAWDDHEIANDDWMHGAGHHDPAHDGDWEKRKAAAVRAYLEWMPIRDPVAGDPYGINRSFAFGDLATLVMPETRLKARTRQMTVQRDLEYHIVDARDPDAPKRVVDAEVLASLDRAKLPAGYRLEPDLEGFRAKLADPARQMIGDAQLEWIRREVKAHVEAARPWFLFGSESIVSSYVYPDMTQLGTGPASREAFYALTRYGLPMLNLDSWDGYPAERERLYDIFESSGANVVVLSGDSHMAWINEPRRNGRRMALELSASTLTGPSLGELLLPNGPVGRAFEQLNPEVQWCDPHAVGYVAVTLTRDQVHAGFVSVQSPRERVSKVQQVKRVQAEIRDGQLSAWQMRPSAI